MNPHGPYNPAQIDPADYPARALLAGVDPDAATLILWFDRNPLPFDDDLAAAVEAVSVSNGHFLLLARDPSVLAEVEAAIVGLHHGAEGSA